MAFVLVLSYSRYAFVRFYLNASLAIHPRPRRGVPCARGSVLYDNMKSVVLERRADAIRFHPTLLELAAHYRFEPRPVAPARGEVSRFNRSARAEWILRNDRISTGGSAPSGALVVVGRPRSHPL